jgi:hypothetical protein
LQGNSSNRTSCPDGRPGTCRDDRLWTYERTWLSLSRGLTIFSGAAFIGRQNSTNSGRRRPGEYVGAPDELTPLAPRKQWSAPASGRTSTTTGPTRMTSTGQRDLVPLTGNPEHRSLIPSNGRFSAWCGRLPPSGPQPDDGRVAYGPECGPVSPRDDPSSCRNPFLGNVERPGRAASSDLPHRRPAPRPHQRLDQPITPRTHSRHTDFPGSGTGNRTYLL